MTAQPGGHDGPESGPACFVCRKHADLDLTPGSLVGVHLIPRYPGTPREFWWQRLDEWPGAKLGGEREITDLVSSLRKYLGQ